MLKGACRPKVSPQFPFDVGTVWAQAFGAHDPDCETPVSIGGSGET